MRIAESPFAPEWIQNANVKNEDVTMQSGIFVWHRGEWYDGEWRGGEWLDNRIDRVLLMASQIGIVFQPDGTATAYRTTKANGHGRHDSSFIQTEGEYFEANALPAGRGTCVRGIHCTSQARAHTYFGIDITAQLWEVKFRREDLLDCDGEKARIRGGTFRKIETPFFLKTTGEKKDDKHPTNNA